MPSLPKSTGAVAVAAPAPFPISVPVTATVMPNRCCSNLPEECLLLIFENLRTHRSALHVLIRVNRQFFHLVVPILYRSPFRLLESKQETWPWSERIQRQVLLLQLLLRSAQIKQKQINRQEEKKWQRKRGQEQSEQAGDRYNNSCVAVTTGKSAVSPIVAAQGTENNKMSLRLNTKRRQHWWAKKKPSISSSTIETALSNPSSPSSLLFPSLSLSRKGGNIKGITIPGKIQGRKFISEKKQSLFQDDNSNSTNTSTSDNSNSLSTVRPTTIDGNIPNYYGQQQCQQQVLSPFSSSSNNSHDQSVDLANYGHTSGGYSCESFGYNECNSNDVFIDNNEDDMYRPCEGNPTYAFIDSDDYNSYQYRPHSISRYYTDTDTDADDDETLYMDELPHSGLFSQAGLFEPTPHLGPFSPKDNNGISSSRSWTQAFQTRFRSFSGSSFNGINDQSQPLVPQSHRLLHNNARLMADYLSYYVEHDHPRLARLLPSLFPSVPAESFDQLLTFRDAPNLTSSSAVAAAAAAGGGTGSPLSSLSGQKSVYNIFQSLQQSHKSARNLERAYAARTRVERDLFHHSPQLVRTLSLSAARIQAIIPPPLPPQSCLMGSMPSTRSALRTSASSYSLGQSLLSPFISLMSLLPSSFFSRSPFSVPISSSSSSSWHSSASTLTVSSFRSSHSVATSYCSSFPYSTDSLSLTKANVASLPSSLLVPSSPPLPQLSQLSSLYRIELYDIYHGIDVEVVVRFLRLHDQIYHTIREVKVGGVDDVGRSSDPGVITILYSLKTVRVLDMVEWREAIRYMNQIPTKHLESLLLGNVRMANHESVEPSMQGVTGLSSMPSTNADTSTVNGNMGSSSPEDGTADGSEIIGDGSEEDEEGEYEEKERSHPQIQALQRCRRLRVLRMPVLVNGLFGWAVKERRQWQLDLASRNKIALIPVNTHGEENGHLSKLRSLEPYWGNKNGHRRPVQLENVHLSGTSTGPLMSTLIHVVDAFRDSLQVLQSTSWMDSTEAPLYACCLSLSWAWCLPQLEVLDLQGEVAYRFQIQTLQYCPKLRVLRLSLPHSVLPSRQPTGMSSSAYNNNNISLHHHLSSSSPEMCQRCMSGGSNSLADPSKPEKSTTQLPPLSLADYLRAPSKGYSQYRYAFSALNAAMADNSINSNNNSGSSHGSNSHSESYYPYQGQRTGSTLFPNLQELRLAGDWGLCDESLLQMAKMMPRLSRLSLLRCETECLTACGLIRALLRFRGYKPKDLRQWDGDDSRIVLLQWLEICKTWHTQIEAVLVSSAEGDIIDSVAATTTIELKPLEISFLRDSVNHEICPLEIAYQ
ncbi:hypothetical protein BX616_007248 [Lobosporangium transversale]|uniref:F-box domain-containing protein n=1 Tax=Lobosporangium transversale TaxID=64571 RepID=A0A1Y2GHV6_9FUNG|nr:hypothetical protein BCR41DRAFT_357139 [Lobosporangium transversale]KAF9914944.1 hypothetical protein BX616_007248 [Lobosporangium transversale]ORZ11389.1 hypothetical protein BCR41DRAFT_357139 [Lobosporangium transversale]|eukprot:XP_021879704.1 hypothetical protein BCR41DRAFT_357139 [Lobosporangium transversale]